MAASTRPTGDRQPEVWLDSRQLRVLAHPLRSRLLSALRLDGPATATGLARVLDTNTGATSYHLRQLAEVGLVVEEPDRGAGRQRFWRAAHANHGWWLTDHPDDQAALDWLAEYQVTAFAEEAAKWRAAQHQLPREWQDAATQNDYGLRLTAERLRALNDELAEVIVRYRDEAARSTDDQPTEEVAVFFASFPRVTLAKPGAPNRGPGEGGAPDLDPEENGAPGRGPGKAEGATADGQVGD
ncbi:helix-turn-helix domain-containing protein [Micromonospora polyrhachis]|uniref:Putative ArsR family transcriptional regulator n=1 Tax=Micromonospora polyrhachis TaxID=1282883 RepID=A0A7W7WSP8_9ACTN|nr:putative ArsR family transcriptional regulator [Micromonospora polyrhachis]